MLFFGHLQHYINLFFFSSTTSKQIQEILDSVEMRDVTTQGHLRVSIPQMSKLEQCA